MLTQAAVSMLLYTHSPTYTTGMLQKVQHKSESAQVINESTCGQLYTYIQESILEIRTPSPWKLIGHSMTNLPPALSLSSIRPPPSSPRGFSPTQTNLVHVSKLLLFQFYLGRQRLHRSKLCTLKLLMSGSVCIVQKWLPSKCRHYHII